MNIFILMNDDNKLRFFDIRTRVYSFLYYILLNLQGRP